MAAAGRVRGRPLPRRPTASWFISGMNCGQSPRWPGVRMRVRVRSAGRRPGESWWTARPGSGPAPPARPARRPGSLHSLMPPVAKSAGGTRRAPAACWWARTTVESALTARCCLRLHHSQPAAGPRSWPRCHRLTSGDAGYRPSSSARTPPAHHARGTPSASGTRSRRSPSGDRPTGHPAADQRETTPAAAPTPHRSDHDDSADQAPY